MVEGVAVFCILILVLNHIPSCTKYIITIIVDIVLLDIYMEWIDYEMKGEVPVRSMLLRRLQCFATTEIERCVTLLQRDSERTSNLWQFLSSID